MTTINDQKNLKVNCYGYRAAASTTYGSANIERTIELTQSHSQDMPNQMYMLDLCSTVAPNTTTDYAGSIFDKAPIGSKCRVLIITAGVVTGAAEYLKKAKTGTATDDWKLITTAA